MSKAPKAPPAVNRPASPHAPDDPERRAKRSKWPPFERPTAGDIDRIARLRGLGRDGLELAVDRGILWIIEAYHGHCCWVVTDDARLSAQARRLDGLPFKTGTHTTKALTLPGSITSWPVGFAALTDNHHAILLTEGGPDVLAAHQFIVCEGRQRDGAAVGMFGASCSIAPEVAKRFKGRAVRIALHADTKGREAAERWARQLLPYATTVEGMRFDGLRQFDEQPVKDLNDLARLHPDDFEANRWVWSLLP